MFDKYTLNLHNLLLSTAIGQLKVYSSFEQVWDLICMLTHLYNLAEAKKSHANLKMEQGV